MKTTIIILIVIIVAGGVFWYTGGDLGGLVPAREDGGEMVDENDEEPIIDENNNGAAGSSWLAIGEVCIASDGGCAPEAYCAANSCGGTGVCTIKPEICTLQYDPVCGCDGKTYGNACVAAGAGINTDYTGECS